jgi:hypothetical protein
VPGGGGRPAAPTAEPRGGHLPGDRVQVVLAALPAGFIGGYFVLPVVLVDRYGQNEATSTNSGTFSLPGMCDIPMTPALPACFHAHAVRQYDTP